MSVGVSQTVVTPYVTEIAPVRSYRMCRPLDRAEPSKGPMPRSDDRHWNGMVCAFGRIEIAKITEAEILIGRVLALSHVVS
jgi:hypothetical protein